MSEFDMYAFLNANPPPRANDARDEFAMRAMTMFTGMDITCDSDIRRKYDFSEAASLAYQYADAMMKERAK